MKIVQLQDIGPEDVSHNPDIIKRVLLHEHELPHSVRLSHAVFRPGQYADRHSHDDLHEVFYILSGRGTLIVDGENHAIAAGNSFCIEPGEKHELLNSGSEDMAVLYFGLRES